MLEIKGLKKLLNDKENQIDQLTEQYQQKVSGLNQDLAKAKNTLKERDIEYDQLRLDLDQRISAQSSEIARMKLKLE